MLQELLKQRPHLRTLCPNVPGGHEGGGGGGAGPGIWINETHNSKRAAAYLHNDYNNLAHGWCAIQSLGDFNPKTGGHLVMYQLGLVVEFPPGSTILLPSATVTHGNVPVGAHKNRASIIRFSAAGVFRWVEYGFRTEKQFKEENPEGFCRMWAE